MHNSYHTRLIGTVQFKNYKHKGKPFVLIFLTSCRDLQTISGYFFRRKLMEIIKMGTVICFIFLQDNHRRCFGFTFPLPSKSTHAAVEPKDMSSVLCSDPWLNTEEQLLTPHSSKVSSLLLIKLGYILVIFQMLCSYN